MKNIKTKKEFSLFEKKEDKKSKKNKSLSYYKNNTNEKFTAFSVSNLYSGGGDSYLWSVDAHNESSVYVSPAFRIGG